MPSSHWKKRFAGGVLALTVMSLMGVLNLPFRYVECDARWIGDWQFPDAEFQQRSQNLPTMAGWPLRYWIRYEFDDQMEDRYWSTPYLLINLAIGVAAAAIVFAFTHFRQRERQAASERPWVRICYDITIAFLIVLGPLTMLVAAQRTKMQHLRLVGAASRFGNCYVSCWLPEPVASSLPAGFVDALSRIRQARLVGPSDHIVGELVTTGTLTGFQFQDGRFDSASLEPLSSNTHFYALSITGTELDDALIHSIGQLRFLTDLNLRNTDLDTEMLHRFDSMPRLRRLDLLGTRIDVSKLGKPKWSSTIEMLRLPRPNGDKEITITIDRWPQLRTLSIVRRSPRLNDSTITVCLTELPELERVMLDRVQKHALIGADLPRFTGIEENASELFFMLAGDQHLPGLTWLSKLHLDGVVSLSQLGCYGRDLESLSINNAPNLRRLSIGSYMVYAEGVRLESVDAICCQSWIDHLGRGDGPVRLDFTALPLAGINLTPLAANSRIRELQLPNTGVTFDQIEQLGSMLSLEKLDLSDCPLQGDQLSRLLEQFPNLNELDIDVASLESFEVSGNDRLRRMVMTKFGQLRKLRITDVPRLVARIHLQRTPQDLVITAAPSLRGLAIEEPWPKQAEVSGLRDLEWFAAGGSELDDALVDQLLLCEALDQLTLAHSSISAAKLAELGKLSELTSLVVPGATVDDRVTANWHGLTMLQELNVNDSSISEATLVWLAGIDSLRRLSIDRVTLNDEAADELRGLVQLTELSVADASFDPRTLIALLSNDTLEQLNISGWQVDADLADALTKCPAMRWLTMHRCNVSEDALLRITTANPLLQIDLGDQTDDYSEEFVNGLAERIEQQSAGLGDTKMIVTADNIFELLQDEQEPKTTNVAERRQRQSRHFQYRQSGTIDPDRFREIP